MDGNTIGFIVMVALSGAVCGMVGLAFLMGSRLVAADSRNFALGPAAQVTVIACTSSSNVHEAASNVTISCDLQVTVATDSGYRNSGQSSWRLTACDVVVPLHMLGSFRPGLMLPAKVHATDPYKIRFLWEDISRVPA